ncbi:MAG: Uncharacterised protein [Synechococcus sp. MIT S9220]|nr:MAG: Uncharacterised protein [Synechococcus sp. MIT S9220]
MDLAIHHHQHALPAGLGADCHLRSLVQIQRAISTEGRGRAHRSHQHHRPRVIDQQLQQPGGFLKGIGAMGDHHPRQVGINGQRLADARHQSAPVIELQISAVNVGDLFRLNLSKLLQLGNGLQQLPSANGTR